MVALLKIILIEARYNILSIEANYPLLIHNSSLSERLSFFVFLFASIILQIL